MNSLGALFIGLVLSAVLNGVTYSQTWFYFSAQQQRTNPDPLWLKTMVVAVVVLDLLHQLFTSHWMYDYCVTNFGNSAALNVLPCHEVSNTNALFSGATMEWHIQRDCNSSEFLCVASVEAKSAVIAGAIWSVSLAQFGKVRITVSPETFADTKINFSLKGHSFVSSSQWLQKQELISATDYVARVFHVPNATDLSLVLGNYAILVNALGAACDIFIACAMVFYLRQSQTSIKRTNHMLRSITVFTVTTGIVSRQVVCAIMVLSMAGAYPGTNIELTFYFMLTRLYANSFLATLNVRDHMRELSNVTGGIITTSNFVHTRTTAGADVHSHELDDFPRQKGTQNFGRSHGELEDVGTVISVKVDRITDADYK
ncbi:hypothetical protein EV360DRAFT_80756 [Lentinula raphanica]|nr:hypothetical protein EV360DRAFT_80756 [Lentinula raphanica]